MHLDEEQVQRLLHGETAPRVETGVRDHLARCEECRSRLVEAEREERWVLERLGRVDRAPPPVVVEAILNRGDGRARGAAIGKWRTGHIRRNGVALVHARKVRQLPDSSGL